jgi:broad specificity polyphosphatase/5'/3'-nucleotidase SurE
MENIGDGANVRKTGASSTAELSQPSEKIEKRRTKSTKQPTTPAEATELLTSALGYCLEAGLIVSGYNEGQTLILSIDGVRYADGRITVTPISASVTTGVTL